MSWAERRTGIRWSDHRRPVVGIAQRKRAHGRSGFLAERRSAAHNCSLARAVRQRDAVSRPPVQMLAHILDQAIGFDRPCRSRPSSSAGNPIDVSASLAPLARCRPSLADTKALRARWERNSFSASTRSFSIGPRLMIPLDAEDDVISGRHLQAGAGRPSEPVRTKEIAVDRFAFELIRGPEIMLDEKPRHRLPEQADAARAAGEPAILDIGRENVLQVGRGGPFQNPVAGREQQAAARIRPVRRDHPAHRARDPGQQEHS